MPDVNRLVLLVCVTGMVAGYALLTGCALQSGAEPTERVELSPETEPSEVPPAVEPTATQRPATATTRPTPGPTEVPTQMPVSQPTIPPEYQDLLTRVQTSGSLRVIVTLNVPFTPEGDLGDEAVRQ